MKKTKLHVIALLASMIVSTFAGCGGCNQQPMIDPTPVPTVIPTIAPTMTVAPTDTPVPTPTKAVEVIFPTNTPTPEPSPSPIPTPTNTPVPTATPVPKGKLLASCQVGDNAWFDYYEDGLLILRGTGATYGFKDNVKTQEYFLKNLQIYDKSLSHGQLSTQTKTIIIEEGISEIGNAMFSNFWFTTSITFPESLKTIGEIAFEHLGWFSDSLSVINLNTSKVEIFKNAFYGCPSANTITGLSDYAVAPTATPKPTATPTPNPDKPRKAATLDVGNNITYEFWDNGVMYVKGKGSVPTQGEFFCLDTAYTFPAGYTLADKVHTIIVEEGITQIGEYTFRGLPVVDEIYLPSTLKVCDNPVVASKTIHGYHEGKPVTITTANDTKINCGLFLEILADESLVEKYEATITWD